jgi:hypothetical protein
MRSNKNIRTILAEILLGRPLEEFGIGDDRMMVRVGQSIIDRIQHSSVWHVDRWNSEEDREKKMIYRPELALEMFNGFPQFSTIFGNVLLNEGINAMW